MSAPDLTCDDCGCVIYPHETYYCGKCGARCCAEHYYLCHAKHDKIMVVDEDAIYEALPTQPNEVQR